MFECKILTGHERLDGCVTPCWITEMATCSALNCSVRKTSGLSTQGNRSGRRVPSQTNADVKNSVCVTACPSLLHSCTPCVALSGGCYYWRHWTSSPLHWAEPVCYSSKAMYISSLFTRHLLNGLMCSYITHSTCINAIRQIVCKAVYSCCNEFNTVLSAILTIQSRDSQLLHKLLVVWINLRQSLCALERQGGSMFTDPKEKQMTFCMFNQLRSVSSIIPRNMPVYFCRRMALLLQTSPIFIITPSFPPFDKQSKPYEYKVKAGFYITWAGDTDLWDFVFFFLIETSVFS